MQEFFSPQPLEQTTLNSDDQTNPNPNEDKNFPVKKNLSNKKMLIILGTMMAMILIAGGVIWQNQSQDSNQEEEIVQVAPEEEEVIKNEEPEPVAQQPEEVVVPAVLFTKDPDRDSYHDLQAWMMSSDGSNLSQLDLPDFSVAFKYLTSNEVFFTKGDGSETIVVKNIATNQETIHTPITHPNPEAIENVTLKSLSDISPDGSALVFDVYFTKLCPPFSPPPGYQGGGGPCEPDQDPNTPGGDYLYLLDSKKKLYLGEAVVSRWDTVNDKLYFVDYKYNENGLFVVDLKTLTKSLVDDAQTFGYGAVPFFNSPNIVKVEGTTGGSNEAQSMSKISLVNTQTKQEKVIDSGKWADIQPLISISPDEKYFIFLKTDHQIDGHAYGRLFAYEMATGKVTQVTPNSDTVSYSIKGMWVDNETFITLVDTIERDKYYNGNNYLVSINVTSGKNVRLTPTDDVYRFTQN